MLSRRPGGPVGTRKELTAPALELACRRRVLTDCGCRLKPWVCQALHKPSPIHTPVGPPLLHCNEGQTQSLCSTLPTLSSRGLGPELPSPTVHPGTGGRYPGVSTEGGGRRGKGGKEEGRRREREMSETAQPSVPRCPPGTAPVLGATGSLQSMQD